LATPTPIVIGRTRIARRAAQDVTAPVRSRSTAEVVTIACRAALKAMKTAIAMNGENAAPIPERPTVVKTTDAREMSRNVEIGGAAKVAPNSANGPWNPRATRTVHSTRTTTGMAATRSGVATTTVNPRANEVRILGIGDVPGARGANRSRNPLRGSGSWRRGSRYDDVERDDVERDDGLRFRLLMRRRPRPVRVRPRVRHPNPAAPDRGARRGTGPRG
jgi:hypothetical protein